MFCRRFKEIEWLANTILPEEYFWQIYDTESDQVFSNQPLEMIE